MSTTTDARTESLSVITRALEEAHEIIRQKTGAPRATILVTRKTGNVMGHFTNWQPWSDGERGFHEIMISAEHLARGPRAVLGTLLHEVAHSLDMQAGIKGTSGDGYHNRKFALTAEALGLIITQAPRIGWSVTEVPDSCADRWADALAIIEEGLRLTAQTEGKRPKGRNKNLPVAECGCGGKIRASLTVLEQCTPVCQNCGDAFEIREG